MFDSITLFFFLEFPITPSLWGWDHNLKHDRFGKFHEWHTYFGEGLSTKSSVKYYPKSVHNQNPLLIVEIGSVQKLIFGNNFETCTDLNLIIHHVNETLSQIPGLETIDASNGLVRRVDFCYNHQIGVSIDLWLSFLSKQHIPHREFAVYRNRSNLKHKIDKPPKGGVYNGCGFNSQTITDTFYRKQDECLDPRAAGILRHEVRLWKKKTIQKYTGLANPMLKDLTSEIACKVLNKSYERLGIDKDVKSAPTIHDLMVKKLGKQAGTKLFTDYLLINSSPVVDQKTVCKHLGWSKAKYTRKTNALIDAGFSIGMSPGEITLPKLEAKYSSNSNKNEPKVLSDTRSYPVQQSKKGGKSLRERSQEIARSLLPSMIVSDDIGSYLQTPEKSRFLEKTFSENLFIDKDGCFILEGAGSFASILTQNENYSFDPSQPIQLINASSGIMGTYSENGPIQVFRNDPLPYDIFPDLDTNGVNTNGLVRAEGWELADDLFPFAVKIPDLAFHRKSMMAEVEVHSSKPT